MTTEERAEEILGDWLERRGRGEPFSADDLLRAHPDLVEILRPRLDALRVLDQLAVTSGKIAGYRILREIGRGGMGVVYEAEQEALHRKVALKVLHASVATDPETVARFHREAEAAARLEHPHIVGVHDIRSDPILFYTMDLVEGTSLDRVLEERKADRGAGRKLPPDYFRWLADVFSKVASAIHAAHEKDVVHRDLKPSNILLARDGTPRVTDFGLAMTGGASGKLTATGTILGTMHYMAPEQAAALRDKIDARTDVYSLGATLYECLTLRTPFRDGSTVELLSRILSETPSAPRKLDRSIPGDLETIALRAMAKDRRRRYQTAAEMDGDLQRYLRKEPIRAKRPGAVERGYEWARLHPGGFALAVAIVVAVVVGSVAAPAGWYAGRLPIAPPTGPESLASDFAARGDYDLAAAGVAPDAVVKNWSCFVTSERVGGIAVLVQAPATKHLDLCAFQEGGDFLWSARASWRDYETTLGRAGTSIQCLQSVVTRRDGSKIEETLVVGVQIAGRTNLLMVDPSTGAIRGRWDFDGTIAVPGPDAEVVAPLPDMSARPRRLLVAGQRRPDKAPLLAVVELDGTPVQQFTFPLVGADNEWSVSVIDIRGDWSEDRPEVTIDTSEGVFVSFLVRERMLDLATARANLADALGEKYDSRRVKGAFDRNVEERGGYATYMRSLVKQVKEER